MGLHKHTRTLGYSASHTHTTPPTCAHKQHTHTHTTLHPPTPKHAGNSDRQCVELVDVRARVTCRECSLRLLWYWGYSFNRRLMSFTSWWGKGEGRERDEGGTWNRKREGHGTGRGKVNRGQGGGGDSLQLFWQTHSLQFLRCFGSLQLSSSFSSSRIHQNLFESSCRCQDSVYCVHSVTMETTVY